MNIQWYPGHMTKAVRMMKEDIKLIDLVIELVDARLPMSSRNPDIDELGKNKARLILLNKYDLADERANDAWIDYFKEKGILAVKINSKTGAGLKNIQPVINEACKEKIERDRKRGILNRPIRAMVVGIPNVGKSTFINAFAGKNCTKTGNMPGVTKGKQWIRLNKNVELLDTPGILWPKFEDSKVGVRLAFVGSINDQIIDMTELACELIGFMGKTYQGRIAERYNIAEYDVAKYGDGKDNAALRADMTGKDNDAPRADLTAKNDEISRTAHDILNDIAISRACLKKGGEPDIDKAVKLLFDDFRSGKLGRVTLELPN